MSIRTTFLISIISLFTIFFSCKKEIVSSYPSKQLMFSADTVYLDTIFTNTSSSTRLLKVYNKENNWIKIPRVYLGRGNSSQYRLNIDGVSSNDINDVEIAPNDSIFIFIEATIDFNTVSDPLYTDSIVFDGNLFTQNVKLVSLVQDAVFLYPAKGSSTFVIPQDIWTADKPYVIYGYAVVDSAKTLTIEKGANIHFHNSSGLVVYKDASLIANGTKDEKITFQGDRLEPAYENVAGQWGMIWFYPGSYNSELNNVIVKNGIIGARVDSAIANNYTLKIKNTEFYNFSSVAILGQGAKIYGENVIVNNCGEASLVGQIGGDYEFLHSTFANYYSGIRQGPSVFINNYYQSQDGNTILRDLNNAYFGNCIIYGNGSNELIVDVDNGAIANYKFENVLLKYDSYKSSYDPSDTQFFENIILNMDPAFWDQYNNDFRIEEKSAANNKGKIEVANLVPLDFLETARNNVGNIDLGAFQSSDKPVNN